MHDITFECKMCSFKLWLPIIRLKTSTLGLYDDARYPGRCILVFHNHIEDFAELDNESALSFIKDAQKAAMAIRKTTMAERINYAILGNAEPHLHMHLIPRKKQDDPIPNRSPWNHPAPLSKLSFNKRISTMEMIAHFLTTI
jgi:diadenosine tetraphosphate (Ap4A) HIT family hydrolase